ncbi:MAG: protein kinase [bacterium]|nr:MAG: protein kinase [bacterium]
MIGKTISHYKILEKLGEGGMGVIYKAQDTTLDRFVAIKLLPPHLSRDEEATKRFMYEAKAASALDHSNIGTIYEVEKTSDGQMFIAMAYYGGETLRERIDRGDVTVEEALDITSQIAAGLVKAHEKGIVHRDIKPSNILLTGDGEVKIIDFGIAKLAGRTKLTKEGITPGTAAYMSPEQAMGEDVDARSDIFSLGAIFYELIAGEPPFRGEHEVAMLYEIVYEEPRPLSDTKSDIRPEIEYIVGRALDKNRDKRYQSVVDLIGDIESLRDERSASTVTRRVGWGRYRSRKKTAIISAIAVLAVLFVVILMYQLVWRGTAIDSIAVLPLANISENQDEEYFVNGLTGELISQLAQIGELKVISRTSIMQYKNTAKSLPEIARELNVKAILEGAVLRIGNRVRISLELIHAETDRSIWADSYDRDLSDILMLQGEVALDVAKKVKVRLTAEEKEQLGSIQAVNLEAHEAYLKGRFYWNQRTVPALEKSLKYFNEAIAADSNYVSAYAGLADAYIMLGNYGSYGPSEVYPEARKAALRALELNDQIAAAHTSLAIVKWHYDWDLTGAAEEFERAVSLNPNYATAHHWYALYLTFLGYHTKAIDEIQKALSVDPVSLIVNAAVGLVYYFAGDYDEAIRWSRQTLDMNENFFAAYTVLGRAYIQKGKYNEATESLNSVVALSGRRSSVLAILAHPLAASGNVAEAEALYEELTERSRQEYVSPYNMAIITIALERYDEALDWLEKASVERSSAIFTIRVEPLFKVLWEKPEFKALATKVGLNSK